MHLTRRCVLGGIHAFLAACEPPALAQDHPVTAALVIAAAANVVVNLLQFQKQSGEVSLELSALNVKLHQVLRNRVLTLQAISNLDDITLVSG
jgi:hypothetical protein